MRRILLSITVLLFFISSSFAQISMVDGNGDTIEDEAVYTFDNTGKLANLNVFVTNNGSSTIDVNLIAETVTGTDGSDMEFCIGSCHWGIIEGTEYGPITIEAGASTNQGEVHFHNHDSENDLITYVLKIYENGNEDNSITFSYIYDASFVGVNNISENEISIYPNPAKNTINISNNNYDEIIFSNIAGQIVKRISNSQTTISTSEFSNGIYFYQVVKNNAVIKTDKIIVRK